VVAPEPILSGAPILPASWSVSLPESAVMPKIGLTGTEFARECLGLSKLVKFCIDL
jgi:hypothetical protein